MRDERERARRENRGWAATDSADFFAGGETEYKPVAGRSEKKRHGKGKHLLVRKRSLLRNLGEVNGEELLRGEAKERAGKASTRIRKRS